MTTPNIEELIAKLRTSMGDLDCPNTYEFAMHQAADALRSQAERIKVIERESEMRRIELHDVMLESDQLRAQLADAELHTKQVERGLDKATAQLAEIEKTEPVAWINLAASSKMFRFLAPTEEDGTVVKDWQPLFTHPMPAESKDAERYRWLREQHWSTDTIAVVLNPKQAVKLGYVCPSDSLLDETIDAAIAK